MIGYIRPNIIIIIINLDRIAASTRSVGLHAGPQHIRTNKITKQIKITITKQNRKYNNKTRLQEQN